MAKQIETDLSSQPFHRTLNAPRVYLLNMVVFLALVGALAAILGQQLREAVLTNLLLNGLIISVLLFGVLRAFRQVQRLYPEIRWVNGFRIADPGLGNARPPVLLAPMATMLRDRTGALSLSAQSMRSIMDSIGGRLDEARDTSRYLVGLLVFLGLLGTFYGLLDTISAVGKTIGALDPKAADSVGVFDELKAGLAAPLRGMGTAFSASLLGLSGSLVLGFLDLQAGHAHGRFYNELEEWLSGITELAPASGGVGGGADPALRQLYSAVYDMQHTLADLTQRMGASTAVGGEASNGANSDETVRDLAKGVDQLVRQMRAEQSVVRQWVDEQAAQQSEVAGVLKNLAASIGRDKT